ncbi:M28 family peptidase [Planctomycetes bacterium K23_9]|uniref:Aminopeptidase S n=1 Tax=Stieleria marina TaxID=1930275 RepID=A0A517NQI6_9BACT|nr:Aminopeptidase S [Planctomycetes bacterium K23_9]
MFKTSVQYSLFALCLTFAFQLQAQEKPAATNPHADPHAALSDEDKAKVAAAAAKREAELLTNRRRLTFEGRRAGEGYFSADGRRMVFQSERDPANPFYQIYVTDLETGDIEKVSPGLGKTTCAWIHPQGDRILFSSTHDDPQAAQKQSDELAFRESGKERRYSWDYDNEYEIYERGDDGQYKRLTNAKGYDAEASYSPDGSQIVFASNRNVFTKELSQREKEMFEREPSYMIDLFIMNADGTNVRQLTDVRGYDGGPFFSPDGKRICWRRFAENGATAEIYTMNVDGTDVRRLTELNAMSWAPFFHPSGDYLVFTTNHDFVNGGMNFANFELSCVRADGASEPQRVTFTDGFDGLPVFLPNGKQLSWTSNRHKKQSQIYVADWNDTEMRKRLGLSDQASQPGNEDQDAALAAAHETSPEFSPTDIMRHVDYLTRPELGGRLTGTEGERRATAYVAAYLESLGYLPAGDDGTFFHSFDFPAGSTLTAQNKVTLGDEALEIRQDWLPLSFSKNGEIEATGVVFAGYGMKIPGGDDVEEYDSYVHLDVTDKWVMVLRDLPQEITPERRQQLARYSAPRRKATIARDLGAKGIIFVAGPTSKYKNDLIRFDSDASQAEVSIAGITISDAVASKIFKLAGDDLAKTQAGIDDGQMAMGMQLGEVKIAANIDIKRNRGTGRNVIARLPAGDQPNESGQAVVLGAHIDHLGKGGGSNSLAKDDERDQVHVGADDNASGVGSMLEIAQYLASEKSAGRFKAKRDLIVAAWSGEELGLFGSQAYVKDFYRLYPNAPKNAASQTNNEQKAAHAHGTSTDAEPLTAAIATYLNLDMVGRLREKLVIQGIGSSPGFEGEVQRRNVPVGLALTLDKTSTRLPTDASAFVARDVPILAAFTGAHEDYHTPRDTPDKLNYDGAAKISRLFALLARGVMTSDKAPKFELDENAEQVDQPRVRLTAYLGTIPDYVAGDIKGLKLSGVAGKGPAAKAGVQGGDIIIKLAGKKIEDIYDYTYAIEALKIGQETEMDVRRGDKVLTLKVTPSARE